jgi:hypothetical protein
LTRPEGLLLLLALIATLLVIPFWRPIRLHWPRWWIAVGVLTIGPACLVGPYIMLKGGLGTKPSIARLLGTTAKAPPHAVERQKPLDPDQTVAKTYILAAKALFDSVREAVTLPLLPSALIGLWLVRPSGPRVRIWIFLGIIGIASVLALIRLHTTAGYCSPRHTIVLSALIISAAALGMHRVLDTFVEQARRWAWSERRRRAVGPFAWSVVFGGLMLAYAPATLAPVNPGMGTYRAAATWLGTRVREDARIIDVTGWTLFYTGRSGYTFANLSDAPSDPQARWLVAREAHVHGPWDYCEQLRHLIGGREPVAVFRGTSPRHPTKVFIFDRSGVEPTCLAAEKMLVR